MRFLAFIVGLLLVLPLVACSPAEQKPTYAELVTIYGAEAQELDRLERKRAEMVAEYEATLVPSGDAATELLSGLLGGGGLEAAADPPKLDATDPDELLDQAIATAENMNTHAEALIDAAAKELGQQSPDRAEIEAMYSDEFKVQLQQIDNQIAAQRERVEKARAARDAAEAE